MSFINADISVEVLGGDSALDVSLISSNSLVEVHVPGTQGPPGAATPTDNITLSDTLLATTVTARSVLNAGDGNGSADIYLNAGVGAGPTFHWFNNGVETWNDYQAYDSPNRYIEDKTNSKHHVTYTPGAGAGAGLTEFNSVVKAIGNISSNGQLLLGSAEDANLQRISAGVLGTNGVFRVRHGADTRYRSDYTMNASGLSFSSYDETAAVYLPFMIRSSTFAFQPSASTTNQVVFDANGKIVFGSAGDTNFYRSAANSLKTDDNLEVGGALYVVSTVNLAADISYVGPATNRLQVGALGTSDVWLDAIGSNTNINLQLRAKGTGTIVLQSQISNIISTTTVSSPSFSNATNTGPVLTMQANDILLLNRNTVGNVPLLVQGMTGQTGDLQHWRNDAGTPVAKVSTAGLVTAASLSVTGISTFTGIPSGPTAAALTNTTQLATTAFVTDANSTASTADRNRVNHTGSHYCELMRTATTPNIPTTAGAFTFDSEISDASGMHDGTNPSRITIAVAGRYLFMGTIFTGTQSAGSFDAHFRKNNLTNHHPVRHASMTTSNNNQSLASVINCAVADYVEFFAATSGAATATLANGALFSATYLGS